MKLATTILSHFLKNNPYGDSEDRRIIIILQLIIFILISTLLILKPIFTGELLAQNGIEIMPYAYVLIAITAFSFQAVLGRLTEDLSLYRAILGNHMLHILIIGSIVLYYFGSWRSDLIALAFYIYVSLFALVTITYFYQYVQSIFSIRDAKKNYAFIGAAAIAGGIVGGYLTSVLMPLIGPGYLLLICMVNLIITAFLYYYVQSKLINGNGHKVQLQAETINEFNLFRTNRHVRNIALIIGIGVFVAKIIDYQFNAFASAAYTDEEELTTFFGFWFSTINVIGFLVQLFLSNFIVDRFGVARSARIMPITILLATLLLLFSPILAIVIILKITDGSLKQSIYKTATDIFYMPLPQNIRNRAKSFIDVVVDSIATGVAGVTIYIVSRSVQADTIALGIILLILTLVWVYILQQARSSYKEELVNMVYLAEGIQSDAEEDGSEAGQLKNPSEQQRKRYLVRLLDFQDIETRLKAFNKLLRLHRRNVKPFLFKLSKDSDDKIVRSSMVGLVMQSSDINELQSLYDHFEGDLYKYVLFTTAVSKTNNNKKDSRIDALIKKRIDRTLKQAIKISSESKDESLKILEEIYTSILLTKYKKHYSKILESIQFPIDFESQKIGLSAIQRSRNKFMLRQIKFSWILSENLELYYRTLGVFGRYTLRSCKYLAIIQSKDLLSFLPALKYIDLQSNINFLIDLLDHDNFEIRHQSLLILNYCRKQYKHLNFQDRSHRKWLNKEIENLKSGAAAMVLLKEKDPAFADLQKEISELVNFSLLRSFVLLSFVSQRDDLNVVYRALKNENIPVALDYLDDTLSFELKKLIVPIFELVANKRYNREAIESVGVHRMPTKRRILQLIRLMKRTNEKIQKKKISQAKKSEEYALNI